MRMKMVCDDRTLREVANEFLALKKAQKVRERTLNDYKKYIDKFLEQSENSLDVDVLKIEILEYFADIPKTSPARFNHPYQYLHALFEWCAKQDYLPYNPFQKLQLKKVRDEGNVQPAEIVKVLFIVVLAYQLSWLKENYTLKKIPHVAFLVCHLAPLFLMYYLISSDMGSALVMLFIFAAMCFVAGVALRWFAIGGVVGGLAFYILWNENLIPLYMKKRFIVIFDHSYDPMEAGWHQTRSLMTLGGGKFLGQGFGQGTQTQSSYSGSLPARHTDFIFSVIGEELGMVGCMLTLLLLTAIIIRCIIVARNARTKMDAYICVGVIAMLMFQIIANVGMCLFIMPVIGLTLPFFSYGGSSIVMLFVAMGLVSGVHGRSAPDWLKGA